MRFRQAMPMATFDFAFTVRASLDAVLAFHWSPDAVKTLSPPPMILRVHSVEPLAEGSVSRFTLWVGPMPLHWVAVHSNVDPRRGFTDTQAEGPMKSWAHTHTFTEVEPALTEVREHVEYEHHEGARGAFTRVLFNGPALKMLFAMRRSITRRALEHTS
ncbi:MAG: hypothetical protein HOW73_31355 [Polyangiaceae bacterium]|nr:hypothetical protein [Polyangiaceae bacterium]